MAEKKQETTERASVLVEQILGDDKKLATLVTGTDKDRAAIAVSAVTSTGDDGAVQEAFLTSLVRALAVEGDANETDRRDAAVELLKCAALVDILSRHSEALFDAYCEAINNQTKENDPYAGSINSLLDAGIVIAPYFPINDLARTQLTNLWSQRAKDFLRGEGREHIEEQAVRIGERMSELGSRDARVYDLRRRGLKNKEIAGLLAVKEHLVEQSVGRLIESGELVSRRLPKGDTPLVSLKTIDEEQKAQAMAVLVDKVRIGRQEGLTGQEMATLFSVKAWQIAKAIRMLNEEKDSVRDRKSSEMQESKRELPERPHRRTKKEIVKFDLAVESLFVDRKMGSAQIAQELHASTDAVTKSLRRLRKNGRIEQAVEIRSPEELAQFDDRVFNLRTQGKKVGDIASALEVERWSVDEAIVRLRKRKKLLTSRRILAKKFDKKVLKLKKLGLQEHEIAKKLDVEDRPWMVKKSLRRLRTQELIPRKYHGSRQTLKTREIYNRVLQLKRQGLTNQAIAKAVNCSESAVENMVHRLRKSGHLNTES